MKKKNYFIPGRLLAICLSFIIFSTLKAQDIASGLIIHYNFESVSGTLIPDISGKGNVGSIMGGTSLVEGYDGQGANMLLKADFIQLPENFTANLTSFTFAAWVKFSALKNATRFFDLGNGADGTNDFLAFIPSASGDNTNMRLRYRTASGTGVNVDATSKIPLNAWAHVAVTLAWNELSGTATVRLYLNGSQVGSSTTFPYNPSKLGTTTNNNILGVSRWTQDANGFNGIIDDVRFYNRALTTEDIVTLNGMAELNTQAANLTLGDISAVTSDLTLPTVLGTKGVTVNWSSTKPHIINEQGKVTRPEKWDVYVKLTATLMQVIGTSTFSLQKDFKVKVLGITGTPEQLAQWDFSTASIKFEDDTLRVYDILSNFKGKLMNEAHIRTIGNTDKINVLDLGNGKGYFDMGTEIGEAVVSLNDFTMMGFFRINEEYGNLSANGNFIWNFSNSDKVGTDVNGFMYGRLNTQAAGISATGSPSIAANYGIAAEKGAWHHFAFSQNGTVGTVYVDGIQVAQNTNMPTPSEAMAKDNLNGTLFNWLGRSGWASDAYLQQTLLYDFQVLSIPITSEDLLLLFGVPQTIDKLNMAYNENPNYKTPELQYEADNLTLGDLSSITSDIELPIKGKNDPDIVIAWKTSNAALITKTGKVTQPDYFPYNVTLTANLLKNGQNITKDFNVKVIEKPGTKFVNDLLVRYDFSNINDSIVTDVAEKGFKGILKNGAKVHSIGTTTKFNVLELGENNGYFDLGQEIGKLAYNLTNYSIGAYYRIDESYDQLTSNGNFLFTLSNTQNAMTDQSGYIIGSLKDQSLSISPQYYTAASGNQAVSVASPALKGSWHHFFYVQNGTQGTVYVDGTPFQTSDITNLPANTLPRPERLGTFYNWIGRSNYTDDVYLRKTKVYDFRLYNRALTDMEIMVEKLDVGNVISKLEQAFLEDPTAVKNIINAEFTVIPGKGEIYLPNLSGNEIIGIFDITGRKLNFENTNIYKVNAGAYIVKINNFTTKVIIK
jgi:hypothetical protein